jgi:hypothetical protein
LRVRPVAYPYIRSFNWLDSGVVANIVLDF